MYKLTKEIPHKNDQHLDSKRREEVWDDRADEESQTHTIYTALPHTLSLPHNSPLIPLPSFPFFFRHTEHHHHHTPTYHTHTHTHTHTYLLVVVQCDFGMGVCASA